MPPKETQLRPALNKLGGGRGFEPCFFCCFSRVREIGAVMVNTVGLWLFGTYEMENTPFLVTGPVSGDCPWVA